MIALLLSPAALAWSELGQTWPADAFPIPYAVSASLGGGLDDAEALAAIQAGFQAWEDAGCGVSFVYEGRSEGSFGGTADGENVVFVLDEGWPDDASLVSTPAITTSGAEIVEADIALNAQSYAWATSGADGRSLMDVQSAVTHEVGHLLGLWHSSVEGATLNPAMDGNPEARTLEEDDLEGLCALYAESAGGEGALGDPCEESADCQDGLFCLADGDTRYCSQACEAEADCPDGYTCLAVSDSESACAVDLEKEGGCGCSTGQDGPVTGVTLLSILASTVFARRRISPPTPRPAGGAG